VRERSRLLWTRMLRLHPSAAKAEPGLATPSASDGHQLLPETRLRVDAPRIACRGSMERAYHLLGSLQVKFMDGQVSPVPDQPAHSRVQPHVLPGSDG